MEQQLTKQLRLQRSIERTIENVRKVGKGNLTPAKLRSRISSLKETWAQFQEGHDLLSRSIPSTTKASLDYFKEGSYDVTEDAFIAASDFLADLLEELEPFVSPNQSFSNATMRPDASSFSLSHLPPIRLPPFDGTLDDWEQFRDRFTALIRNNKELNDFARMHFLVSCLKGRALECVANLSVTADNFEIAWHTLTTRFEDLRRSLNFHLATILTLNAVNRESSVELQTLLDKVNIAVASLKNLNRSPEQLWNDVLVHSVVSKLDPVTRKAWNLRSSEENSPPSFDCLSRFLHSRVRALEAGSPNLQLKIATKSFPSSRVHVATTSQIDSTSCPLCKAPHLINICAKYMSKSPSARRDIIKQYNRCFNCLSSKHSVTACPSRFSCRVCQRKHHSTLHIHSDSSSDSANRVQTNSSQSQPRGTPNEIHSLFASIKAPARNRVLLATALITVTSSSGRSVVVRALIDQGSEMTFISETLAQSLRTKQINMPMSVSVVGGSPAGTIKRAARISVSPRNTLAPSFSATALILNSITSYTPSHSSDTSVLSHLRDLKWADPNPLSPEPIHILIGADLYHHIILNGVRKGGISKPIAQNSIFGWIISGSIKSQTLNSQLSVGHCSNRRALPRVSTHHVLNSLPLDEEIRRFWESEDLPRKSFLSPQDERCEEYFRLTHSRTPCGRYTVRLPFKSGPPIDIGETRLSAERSLAATTRKFTKNPELAVEYREFISEYLRLGHMSECSLTSSDQRVFIPHHAVIRANSLTSHLRVVFNASSVSSNGTSLNDHLLVGSKLQSDLASVIAKWRTYKFVYSADITKMYRQIRIDPRELKYQSILWRSSPSESIQEFQLLTVTYGMACAPFLALRVLQQLVDDEGSEFPLAAPILRDNIYVDDILFGANDIEVLKQTRDQLISLLGRGGFDLRKWSSNSSSLLADIDSNEHGLACSRTLSIDDRVNILGIIWNPASDTFEFQASTTTIIPNTKRLILSTIAKLYDPLGWVTPVTISAKILMQDLWRLKIGWDELIPHQVSEKWRKFYTRLPSLNGLAIRRWTGFTRDAVELELHGFADASASAYAAVVYLKVKSKSAQPIVTLLAGKSKVAPLTALNIPRLELCAALLLVRLLEFVRDSPDYDSCPCFCWTDSTITLAWINQHPSRWKTYVANRVHEIQTRLPTAKWMHVSSEENPADCASRGCFGDEMNSLTLWWQGPSWLTKSQNFWPRQQSLRSADTSHEQKTVSLQCSQIPNPWDLSTRYSSWPKLIRVTAYLFKFIDKCRKVANDKSSDGLPRSALTADQCYRARTFWLKWIQAEVFSAEIHALSRHQSLSAKNHLLSLQPFIDQDGLLRVGGRLKNSTLPFSVKHPILLSSHPVTTLIVAQAHLRALHAGTQLTLSVLRQDFWIIRARGITKSVIHRCLTCVRERAKLATQLMGDLPKPRISWPNRSFQHAGVDYAGPVHIRNSAGRGFKSHKAYIALFVCLATKAVHLELVSDCSTPAFVNAFSRFCARRGLPQAMYSDNGTTFTGADRDLAKSYRQAMRDPAFLNSIASDKIEWNFIPPAAPHFGGLWEAGVKSVKHHLRRVMGKHTLTMEEFSTLLCKIEACLNSRPLAPLSDTINDYECLTPGHFLVGSATLAPPEPSLLDLNVNRLSRWQLVQHLAERFWKIWQLDYVNTLQQRAKWRKVTPSIGSGQLVLLRNATLPPCKWELGRVTHCHPGSDGLVRVVTVKTAASEYRRPITTLCVLPTSDETKSC